MTPFESFRDVPASPDHVLAAFRDPVRLARWWGPNGFTSTFDVFEFKPGGRWVFTMHGPDGRHYPNENIFLEISPEKVVIDHISFHRFLLTITLTPSETGTRVHWHQAFESDEEARRIAHIVAVANEENLDRWVEEVKKSAPR